MTTYENLGDRSTPVEASYSQAISLLFTSEIVHTTIFIPRIINIIVEQILPESQHEF